MAAEAPSTPPPQRRAQQQTPQPGAPAPPPPPPVTPGTPRGRMQALKDLKLTIEYKHLKQNAPGGVLVTPAFDNLRRWHGVIFLRRGVCEGAVFKFTVRLPPAYNDRDVYPEVQFLPPGAVFNPFVDPATGNLDLETTYPSWDPSCHFMITVLTFVKKIFYLKDSDVLAYPDERCFDEAAKRIFLDDKPEFKRRCQALAARSQETVYDVPVIPSGGGDDDDDDDDDGEDMRSPLVFSEPNAAHEALRKALVEQSDGGVTVRSSAHVLEACREASQIANAKEAEEGSGSVSYSYGAARDDYDD